jgi:hypothetical protein
VDFFQELKQLVATLESRKIDYALCGGVALAIHGAPRATQDIDVLLQRRDIERLREAAGACGFTLESVPVEFSSGVSIQRFTKLIDGQPLMLDVLFVGGFVETVWADRQQAEFDGGLVRVVSREGLIALELAAGRPQDVADVKRLQEAGRG